MLIGIFSKLGASGGSEHRCAEMANSIVRYTEHECWLLCEKDLSEKIAAKLDNRVRVVKRIFKPKPENVEELYKVDSLLIVNSDSYSFARPKYWMGECEEHHACKVDLDRIKQMVFLFNFVITPSRHLAELAPMVKDLRVICANKKFFNEINEKEKKFRGMRHLPRIILDSPIDPGSITTTKTPSDKIRIGKHSKAHGYKFDAECTELIKRINDKYGDKVEWDFLGVPKDRAKEIKDIKNVTVRPEYSIDVGEYLQGIDIFLFFISWGRNEPWSRAVAEGMTAGCPVLATNKAGNQDQVIDGNSGYLCNDLKDFEKRLSFLIKNPHIMRMMGRNGHIYSSRFTSQAILKQYLDFITA